MLRDDTRFRRELKHARLVVCIIVAIFEVACLNAAIDENIAIQRIRPQADNRRHIERIAVDGCRVHASNAARIHRRRPSGNLGSVRLFPYRRDRDGQHKAETQANRRMRKRRDYPPPEQYLLHRSPFSWREQTREHRRLNTNGECRKPMLPIPTRGCRAAREWLSTLHCTPPSKQSKCIGERHFARQYRACEEIEQGGFMKRNDLYKKRLIAANS